MKNIKDLICLTKFMKNKVLSLATIIDNLRLQLKIPAINPESLFYNAW